VERRGTRGSFRFAPPAERARWIERPRLRRLLDRRFTLDLLVVAAPAGYGKTTALSQALAANADGGLGVDLWLQCEPGDDDPEGLSRGLLQAVGLPPHRIDETVAARVADAMLRFAPRAVCLVVDDTHLLGDDSPSWTLLGEVLDRLPADGHLLLSGRLPPPIPTARLQADGQYAEIGVDDLAYDDDEIGRAIPTPHGTDTEVGRWPAMASLLARGAGSETADFLLQEVAAELGTARRSALAALCHRQTVDEGIVRAASDGRDGAADLLSNLPLVQRTDDGSFQLHDLWREALASDDGDEATRRARSRVARHLLDDGRYVQAAREFAGAGDTVGVHQAVLAFARQPLMHTGAAELRQMAAIATRVLPDASITVTLRASMTLTEDEHASARAFEEAARLARERGEPDIEALALYGAANMHAITDPNEVAPWLLERATELAEAGDATARSVLALSRYRIARASADAELAVLHLADLRPTISVNDRVECAFAMSDLGRPEDVATPDEAGLASAAGGQYLAQAYWLRGDVSPELALRLGTDQADATDERRIPHVQISTNAVMSLVANAAGDLPRARQFADRAKRWCSHTGSASVRSFAALADAATLVGETGEEAARRRIDTMLDEVPITPWPCRSYLYALPLLYLLAPRTREFLDGASFGPAIGAARDAGHALARLREAGDPDPATDLPWHRPWLLRAHVLPPHLAELAAAAGAAGDPRVGGVLDQLPAQRAHLESATALDHRPTTAWAAARVKALPARPPYDLRIGLLGPMTVARGTTFVTDAAWVRRERVRQLMAYLVHRGRTSRHDVAEALWPDLPADRALENLRVNLSHLQRLLQPDRRRGDPPWFVRAESELIEVASVGVEVDARRFEDACKAARRHDEKGRGSLAIERYHEAADLHRGDYLLDWPELEWAAIERTRLRTLAVASICRLGELLLARGEPEEAARWGSEVLQIEPLLERGHRLFLRSLVAQDDRPGARAGAQSLLAQLAAEGLEPEPDTVRFLAGIDLPV
jgi:DNA-binding SARP family transcriptional activator